MIVHHNLMAAAAHLTFANGWTASLSSDGTVYAWDRSQHKRHPDEPQRMSDDEIVDFLATVRAYPAELSA